MSHFVGSEKTRLSRQFVVISHSALFVASINVHEATVLTVKHFLSLFKSLTNIDFVG